MISKSTDANSCPPKWKIWAPASKADYQKAYTATNSFSGMAGPHFIVDVTRPSNGCGGCTNYAMNSGVSQQSSWKTTDGAAWWLRDSKYGEPNGDYHANCYLHITHIDANNVRFNDLNCNYYSKTYLCQPEAGSCTGAPVSIPAGKYNVVYTNGFKTIYTITADGKVSGSGLPNAGAHTLSPSTSSKCPGQPCFLLNDVHIAGRDEYITRASDNKLIIKHYTRGRYLSTGTGVLEVFMMVPGHTCPPKFFPIISSWQDCNVAARSLGFVGKSVDRVSYYHNWGKNRPQGCFQSHNGDFHFNPGLGGPSKQTKIVCKSSQTFSPCDCQGTASITTLSWLRCAKRKAGSITCSAFLDSSKKCVHNSWICDTSVRSASVPTVVQMNPSSGFSSSSAELSISNFPAYQHFEVLFQSAKEQQQKWFTAATIHHGLWGAPSVLASFNDIRLRVKAPPFQITHTETFHVFVLAIAPNTTSQQTQQNFQACIANQELPHLGVCAQFSGKFQLVPKPQPQILNVYPKSSIATESKRITAELKNLPYG